MNKIFLIFMTFMSANSIYANQPAEDDPSSIMPKLPADWPRSIYGLVEPIMLNERIPELVRDTFFWAYRDPSTTNFFQPDFAKYMEKLKNGELSEEEIRYPVELKAKLEPEPEYFYYDYDNNASDEPSILDIVSLDYGKEISPPKKSAFEIEITNNDSQPKIDINFNNYEEEYLKLCSKLKTWSDNFDQMVLTHILLQPELQQCRILPPEHWTVAPLYNLLERSQFSSLKKILIVVDSYDFSYLYNIAPQIVANSNGYWGPVIVLKINVRKFMDSAPIPREKFIAEEIVEAAMEYYCKNYTWLGKSSLMSQIRFFDTN